MLTFLEMPVSALSASYWDILPICFNGVLLFSRLSFLFARHPVPWITVSKEAPVYTVSHGVHVFYLNIIIYMKFVLYTYLKNFISVLTQIECISILHFKCFCYDFSVFFINNWSCRVKGRTWFSQRKSWHNWQNRPVVFGLLICCSCCCLEVILIINANAIHPFSSAYPVQGHGEWESILASIKQEAGYTRMYPARHRANAI